MKTCPHGFMVALNTTTSGVCPECAPRPKGTATVIVRPADRVRAEDQHDLDLEAPA